jgi:hypothetical protein
MVTYGWDLCLSISTVAEKAYKELYELANEAMGTQIFAQNNELNGIDLWRLIR